MATGDGRPWMGPRPTLPPFLVIPVVETSRELRRAPATAAIIAVSLLVVGLGGPWPSVIRNLEVTSGALAGGELWRLVTYLFPHEGGWAHVGTNMALLALFGWQLERVVGHRQLLVAYLGGGAIGMALLSAFNPIEAERGLRSGASLAVFAVVAALATLHVSTDGLRSSAIPWAFGTCLVLLTGGGVLTVGGHGDVIEPGPSGFAFGFLNHALGMVAGVLLGITMSSGCPRAVRWGAAGVSLVGTVAALLVGASRWT